MTSVPDDDSLQAALYGTVHIETVQAFEDIDRMLKDYKEQIQAAMAEIEPEIAYYILCVRPETVYAKEPKSLGYQDKEYIRTVELLQYVEKISIAMDMITEWRDSIDRRGRKIGNAERSVRANLSGIVDADYKTAVNRFREGGTA